MSVHPYHMLHVSAYGSHVTCLVHLKNCLHGDTYTRGLGRLQSIQVLYEMPRGTDCSLHDTYLYAGCVVACLIEHLTL